MPRFEPLENRLLLATVTLNPSKDNTLYENTGGALSNGQGQLYAGRTGSRAGNVLRRATMAFDTTEIPAGSTVTAVNLNMTVTLGQGGSQNMSLHRLAADWGEGSSNAGLPGGAGTSSATNDATWIHRFFSTSTWSTPGGDFAPAASGTASVNFGSSNWSAAGMITDVQNWVDTPGANFGWILLGNESGSQNAKRFASSETGGTRPTLTVTFTEPAVNLTVSIAADSVSEAAGAGATTATVTRGGSTASAVLVNLSSNDATEATVPASVTIAAGQATSPAFNIAAVNDNLVDGTQTVTITATATGLTDGTDTLNVTDDDVPTLTLSIAADSISETAGTGATTATVTRNTNTSSAQVVTLASSDATEATVQASVTIAAGQVTSAPFNIDAIDDALVDGTQTVTITGSAASFVDGSDTVDVLDNDVAATVTGQVINGGSVNRSGIDSLLLQFNQPVTLGTASSVDVWNHTTGSALDISSGTLLNNGTTAVTLNLSGIAFPNGFFTAKLPASLGLTATHSFLFHVLAGDSSGNSQVDFADFGDLANAFNTVGGLKFRPGDMNGDGNVDFGDFGILANNFNEVVPAVTLDFGDALETGTFFPVTLPNGARHILGSGLSLGASVDAELNGQPSVGANGDGADEDGVTFATLQAGTNAAIAVIATVPATAVLNAWIDFNRDNDWDDAGEQIFVDQALSNGTNNLTAAIPTAALAGPAYARFRITSCAGHSYFGLARDGEVEDYLVTLVASSSRQLSRVPLELVDAWATPFSYGPLSNGHFSNGPDSRPTGKATADSIWNKVDAQVVDLAVEQVTWSLRDSSEVPQRGSLLENHNQIFEEETDSLLPDNTFGNPL